MSTVTGRAMIGLLAAGCVATASCADEGGSPQAVDTSTTTVDASAEGAATATTVPVATQLPSTTATPVEIDWVAPMVEAFGAYASARESLDAEYSAQASGPGLTEQEFFDLVSLRLDGWADAGDVLLGALPSAVPVEIEALLADTVAAHRELLDALREGATALASGDPEPFNTLVDERLARFSGACAELQGAVQQLSTALIRCGIDREDPSARSFEEGPTVEETGEFVEMPAGRYRLDYLTRAGSAPAIVVELEYDRDLFVRSSIEVLELALDEGGPRLRLHANEYIADPTQVGDGEIVNQWVLPSEVAGDVTPWLDALEGVEVVGTADTSVGGIDARSWDLVNRRATAISVLGDGNGWLPDTSLDPGRPVRLLSVVVGGHTVLITLHPAEGMDLSESGADLDLLLDGVGLSGS